MPITIELYAEGDSWVHKIDPRVKLLFVACAVLVLFVLQSPLTLSLSFALLLVLLLSARIPHPRIKTTIRNLAPVSILMFIIRVIFYPAGPALVSLGPLDVTATALAHGLALAVRIMAMAFAVLAWIYTTDSNAIVLSLVKMGLPFVWGFSLTLALRYIPTLGETYDMILEARQARGFNLQTTRGLGRVRALLPAFISLMIASFRASDELAKALESRAFGGEGQERTFYHRLEARPIDFLFALVILISTLGALFLQLAK